MPVDFWTDLFWKVFLLLQGVYVIGIEVERFQIEQIDPRLPVFRKATNLLKRKLGGIRVLDTEAARETICQLCLDTISSYWTNEIYNNMSVDTIVASARAKLTPDLILEYFFGKALYNSYIRAIEQCERKILIALDGFDIKSENFSLNTQYNYSEDEESKKLRNQFEPLFYRSLIEVVKSLKKATARDNTDSINRITDYCVVLPKDRVDQIQDVTRGFAKFPYCNLSWDAHDLLMMLVLRLEEYFKVKANEEWTLKQRYDYILDTHLPKIPKQITMPVGGHTVSFDLFNYVLRLTLWHPREVIKLFAKIVSLSDDCKNSQVSNDVLRQTLSKKGRENIITEFINEYKYAFENLNQVLHDFDHADIILPFNDFCGKLSERKFITSFAYDMCKIENRFKILYHLGVFGLVYDKKVATEKGLGYPICFVFNEGAEPLEAIIEGQNMMETRAKVILNPALQKYLDLRYNITELIGNFDWTYIEENHMRRDTITRV